MKEITDKSLLQQLESPQTPSFDKAISDTDLIAKLESPDAEFNKPKGDSWSDVFSKSVTKTAWPATVSSLSGYLESAKDQPARLGEGWKNKKRQNQEDGFLKGFAQSLNPVNVAKGAYDALSEASVMPGVLANLATGTTREDIAKMKAESNAQIEANKISDESGIAKKIVGDASTALTQFLPAMALSVATRNPTPALSQGGIMGMGSQYQAQRDGGMSLETSQRAAFGSGLAEAGTELLPLSVLMKGGGSLMTRIIKGAGMEGLEEGITAAINAGIEKGTISPEMTFLDALKSIGYASTVGTVAGAPMAALTAPFAKKDATSPTSSPTITMTEAQELVKQLSLPAPDQQLALPAPPMSGTFGVDSSGNTEEFTQQQAADNMLRSLGLKPLALPAPDQQLKLPAPKQSGEFVATPEGLKGLTEAEAEHKAQRIASRDAHLESLGLNPKEVYLMNVQEKQDDELQKTDAPKPESRVASNRQVETKGRMPIKTGDIVQIAPESIKTDAKAFQFKDGGDDFGVNETLRDVKEFDKSLADPVTVYQKKNGEFYVVDGHQRLGLAKRSIANGQEPFMLDAKVLREEDGITPNDAMVRAAYKNIAQGTGTKVDAAKIFRNAKDKSSNVFSKSNAVARDGQAIAKLSDEVYGGVINEVITPEHGAAIGENAKTSEEQQAAFAVLSKIKPENRFQADQIVKDVVAQGVTQETQNSLFGEEQIADSIYLERAKILDRAVKAISQDKKLAKTLVDKSAKIESTGNQLNKEGNQQALSEANDMGAIIGALANRKGEISDALTEAARQLKSGNANLTEVVRSFKENVARSVREGGIRGDTGRGDGAQGTPEASTRPASRVDDAPADLERNIGDDGGVTGQLKDTAQIKVAIESAPYSLDLQKKSTGWKVIEEPNGSILVNPDSLETREFISSKENSGTDVLRQRANAQGYAIDNPILEKSPKPDSGVITWERDKLFAEGDIIRTASGGVTTPFPRVDATSERKTQNAVKRVDEWLFQNAINEAKKNGDNFNLLQFEAVNLKNISPADRDSAEMYLFEHQPKVVPSILKSPISPKAPDNSQEATYKKEQLTESESNGAPAQPVTESTSQGEQTIIAGAEKISDPETLGDLGALGGVDSSASKYEGLNLPDIESSELRALYQARSKVEKAFLEDNTTAPDKKMTDEQYNTLERYAADLERKISDKESSGESAFAKKDSAATGTEAPTTERTSQGEQTVIAGAEKIGDKQLAERKMDEPKRATKPQKTAGEDGGLFDLGERNQGDLLSATKPAAAAPSKETKNEPLNAPASNISDFGEKIEGAKKDVWQDYSKSLSDDLPDDIASITLSKHFPEPDYESLINEGADVRVLAAIKAMRDEIPAKPKKAWKLKDWAKKVTLMREFSSSLMFGNRTYEEFRDKMNDYDFGSLRYFSKRIDLYAELGYPSFTKAKGWNVNESSVTMYRGQKFSPAKDMWFVRDKPSDFGQGFDTRNEAIAYLREELNKEPSGDIKRTKLDVYQMTATKEIIVGKKIGAGKFIDLKGGFKDAKSAYAYLSENEADLLVKLEQKKEIPIERRSANDPRIGKDYRKGEFIDAEKFANEFGFRGVQFGNYVEQSRRQDDLNNAYDALLDMANLLNLPSRSLSLDGTLGLAFGARGSGGKGAAKAHYEPSQVVINLTKTAGSGSLAHEWWHALDNYFGKKQEGGKYLTDAPRLRKIGKDQRPITDFPIRPEIVDAFAGVMKAIKSTGMRNRSKRLDKRRTKDYWSTDIEMSARALEAYIIHKAEIVDESNDYLANIIGEDAWNAADGDESKPTYPYPTKQEMEQEIAPAFDALFGIMQARDNPNRTLFSRDVGENVSGLTVKQVKNTILKRFGKHAQKLIDASRVRIVQSIDDLPSYSEGYYSDIQGFYSTKGRVYLVADNLLDVRQAENVFIHEAGVHAGMRNVMGADFDQALKSVGRMVANGNKKAVAAHKKAVDAETPEDHVLEETLAYMVDSAPDLPIIKRVVSAIKRWLNKTFGIGELSPQDYRQIAISAIRGWANMQGTTSGNQLFSRTEDITKTPAFKKWFGNSKVVDENGEPLVVYHGTDADFDSFDPTVKRERGSMKPSDLGFWFVASKDYASNHGSRLVEVYLSLQNPKQYTRAQWDAVGKDTDFVALRKKLEAEGHDGIVISSAKENFAGLDMELPAMQVAFSPNQIKSAVGNNGNFDPNDDRILFSRPTAKAIQKKVEEAQRAAGKKAGKTGNSIKQYWKRNLTKEGLLPKPMHDRLLESQRVKSLHEFTIRTMVSDFDNDVRKAYKVKRYNELSESQLTALRDYLAGKNVSIPVAMKTRMDHMRDVIDRASARMQDAIADNIELRINNMPGKQANEARIYISSNGVNGSIPEDIVAQLVLLDKIEGNKGSYLNRSYRAFDDDKWKEKALEDSELIAEAEAFIEGNNPGLTPQEVTGAVRAILQSAKEKGFTFFGGGVKVGKKDISFLKKRKDVPEEIRNLLGEYKDPKVNFVRTMSKMSDYLSGHYFLTKMRKDGLGVIFFERPTGEFDTKIASDNSKTMNPLDGLYTTSDIAQGMEDARGTHEAPDWLKTYIAINSMVKYGKTILSPTTQMRNFISASGFAIANGHWDMSKVGKSFAASTSDLISSAKEWRKYNKNLIALGVIHDNPHSEELRLAINDINEKGWFTGAVGQKTKDALQFMQHLYRFGDDFWKIIGFENEKEQLMKNRGFTESEAEKEAAKRIRDNYPTYSMVPRGIRLLRRFPMVGTFVSFPYEIIRTSKNIALTIADEYSNGSKKIAARKAVGLLMAAGAAHAASQISMLMLGLDDEDDEAVRSMSPEWQHNAQLLYTGYDDDGLPTYLDLSHIDPYTYIKKPIEAILNGNNQGLEKKIIDSAKEALDPFLGVDITTGTIGEIIYNKKENGAPVYNTEDTTYQNTLDISKHLLKLAPGFVSNITNIMKAIDGDFSPSGKQYKMTDEMLALAGIRSSTLNVPLSLKYRSYGFLDKKRDASRILNRTISSPQRTSIEDIEDAYSRMNRARMNAYSEMQKLVEAARSLGMEDGHIYQSMQLNGVSKADASSLLRGHTPHWEIPKTFMRDARAGAILSAPSQKRKDDIRQEFNTRIKAVHLINSADKVNASIGMIKKSETFTDSEKLSKVKEKERTMENILNNLQRLKKEESYPDSDSGHIPLSHIKRDNPDMYALMNRVLPYRSEILRAYHGASAHS